MSLEQGKGLIKFTGGQAVKLDALLADYNLLVQWLQDSCGEEVRVVYFELCHTIVASIYLNDSRETRKVERYQHLVKFVFIYQMLFNLLVNWQLEWIGSGDND